MKILSVGNSFSQDAHKYLYDIANAMGVNIECVNLVIGGCSLEKHYNNLINNSKDYSKEVNSIQDGNMSICEAFESDDWDIITFQQVSQLSGMVDSYFPYIEELVSEARKVCNNSKIYIHQTWAYEIDSTHFGFPLYQNSQELMYSKICNANEVVAKKIHADGIIPVGSVIQYVRDNVAAFDYKNGGLSLNRDGFHLSFDYGRYIAALTWFSTLITKSIDSCNFFPSVDSSNTNVDFAKQIKEAVIKYFE